VPFVRKRYRTTTWYLRRVALAVLFALVVAFIIVFAYVIGRHYGQLHKSSLGAPARHGLTYVSAHHDPVG
jgi:hypothetical protein